jgi:hypothetical protein
MAKILTVLSIILAAIVVAGIHPPLSAPSIACIILFTAGGVVLYHEVCALVDVKPRSQASNTRVSAQVQTDRHVSSAASWSYPAVERRGYSVDLDPSDSVEQIARQMISASFRQAWQKYHAEHGSTHDLPGRIVQAQNLLLTAFRRD